MGNWFTGLELEEQYILSVVRRYTQIFKFLR
jgi:hypothetical protein